MVTPEERARERERIAIATGERVAVAGGEPVSWSGIWAGFMSAMAVMIVLDALGIAIGISMLDANPAGAGNAQGWTIAAGLWMFFTFIIALFTGGFAATRTGFYTIRPAAGVVGTAVWVLSIAAVLVFGAVRFALVATPSPLSAVGLGNGIPPAVAQAAPDLTAALSSGDVDRAIARLADPSVADRIATSARVPRDRVVSTLAGIRGRLEANRTDPASALAQARTDLQALVPETATSGNVAPGVPIPSSQPQVTIAGWVSFFVLIASLGAAVGGARAGVRSLAYVR
jgi:hypothetical protein